MRVLGGFLRARRRADRACLGAGSEPEIAILDTGIRWGEGSLRRKVALNAGELPPPEDAGGPCPDQKLRWRPGIQRR
jgi:hypothetical protein